MEDRPGVADALADLRGGQALVAAVVPLDQPGLDLGTVEAGELRGAPGAHERRGQDRGERAALEQRCGGAGEVLAALGQRDVGEPGVLAGLRPLGLAVAQQHQ